MRITRIEIENFGCLSDYTLELNQDICEIVHDNGYGKSTLASFIRVMLYGFSNEGIRKGTTERAALRPWNSGKGKYGGRLYFEANGKNYILTKVFGETPKADKTTLYRADTMSVTEDFGDSVGEELFGIDAEAYMNSVYIGQGSVRAAITSGIQGSTNISGDTLDIQNFAKIEKGLDERIREVGSTRGKSAVRELSVKIEADDKELRGKRSVEKKIDEQAERLQAEHVKEKELKKSIEAIAKKRERLSANAVLLRDRETYDNYLSELERRKSELEAAENAVKEKTIVRKNPAYDYAKLFMVFGIAGIIGGIIGTLIVPALAVLIIVGAVMTVFGLTHLKKTKYSDGADELARFKYENAIKEYNNAKRQLDAFCENKDIERIRSVDTSDNVGDVSELEALLEQKNSEHRSCIENIREYEVYQRELLDELERLEAVEAHRQKLADELDKNTEFADLLRKTKKYLNNAKIRFTYRYTSPIMNAFKKYAFGMLGAEADKFEMDANLRLSYRDGVESYPIERLSAGMQDMTYLALRGAVMDVMFDEQKPVVVLDDPFINLDDERLEEAKRFARILSESYQVIYLTCHSSRRINYDL